MATRETIIKVFVESFWTYNQVLSSGMFFEYHPDLTGIWSEDYEDWIVISFEGTEQRDFIPYIDMFRSEIKGMANIDFIND